MGSIIEKTDTGIETDVHVFDTKDRAEHYMTVSRGYTFDRHEPWAYTSGFDFYNGPDAHERAVIREKAGVWRAVFWVSTDA